MKTIRSLAAAAAVVATASLVRAADAPAAATFDDVAAKADELPAGVQMAHGPKCASPAAFEFFVDPGFVGSLDCPPDRKACQSFTGPDGASGSVLVFEYAGAVPPFIRRVVEKSLWRDRGRGPQTPDDYVVQGRLLFVFSFPYGDRTGEWAKDRLRTKFAVPARRTRTDLADLESRLWTALRKHEEKDGLAAFVAAGAATSDWAIGSYLGGECAMDVGDFSQAQTLYRRARELSRTLVDPLPDNLAWAALDGVGNALLAQKKHAEAAKILEESLAEGRALHLENDDTPHTSYALACAYVGLGKWDDALRALTDAVDGNTRWLKLAKKADELDAARKRPEFRVLLELDPPPKSPAPPTVVAPPTGAAPTFTFDALRIEPEELPQGWTLVDGARCISTSAAGFFAHPDPAAISRSHGMQAPPRLQFPAPLHKSCQSIVRPDGAVGSVLAFEYASPGDAKSIEHFVTSYCWGESGPTARNPEDIFTEGPRLWVFSFPRGDASGEWAKERLRKRFRIPTPRARPDLAQLMKRVAAAYEKKDVDAALRLLDARAARLSDCAFAWYLRGECRTGKQDFTGAETAYRRAVELHDAFVDPMDEHAVWAALDGLGGALLQQKKHEAARATLVRAKAYAADHAMTDTSVCVYNLACALAQLKRYDEALAALKEAIAAKSDWRASAKDDADFAEARKRPDFQALLAN